MYLYDQLSPAEKTALIHSRLAAGWPLHAPPHPYGLEGKYLITAACYRHQHFFRDPAARDMLEDIVLYQMARHGIGADAYAFLSNHYHIDVDTVDLRLVSEALRLAHSKTASLLNRYDGTPGRRVWYRYSDRMIRSERHFLASINYIHFNPVKHGYVVDFLDWKWSSARLYHDYYGKEGIDEMFRLYPILEMGKGWDG